MLLKKRALEKKSCVAIALALVLLLAFYTIERNPSTSPNVVQETVLQDSSSPEPYPFGFRRPLCNQLLSPSRDYAPLEEGYTNMEVSAASGVNFAYNRASSGSPSRAIIERPGPDNVFGTPDDGILSFISGVFEPFGSNPHYGSRVRFAADSSDPLVEDIMMYARHVNPSDINSPIIFRVIHGGSNKKIDQEGQGDDIPYDLFTLNPPFGTSPVSHDIVTGNGKPPKVAWSSCAADRVFVIDAGTNLRFDTSDARREIVFPQATCPPAVRDISSSCLITGGTRLNNIPTLQIIDAGEGCAGAGTPAIQSFSYLGYWSYENLASMSSDGNLIVYGRSEPGQQQEIRALQTTDGRLPVTRQATVFTVPLGWYLRSLDFFDVGGMPGVSFIIGHTTSHYAQALLGFVLAGPDMALGTSDDIHFGGIPIGNLLGTIMGNVYLSTASSFVNGEYRIHNAFYNINVNYYAICLSV